MKIEEDTSTSSTTTPIDEKKHNDQHEIKEGAAKIVIAEQSATFYNPIQEFNRDLTITVLRTFFTERFECGHNTQTTIEIGNIEHEHKIKRLKLNNSPASKASDGEFKILDALSASGLRAIRFALEVPNVKMILANDFSENAVKSIKQNVELNQLQDKVKPVYSDAIDLMIGHREFEKRFHAIDLDPYGSASTFLDSAVQAVVDGGILMVTCTDTAILCGNTPEACFNKYGSVPVRHKFCHEMALRILLRAIDSHANRYARYIVPLISVSVDFYIRCFVQIHTGAAVAKDSVTKLAQVFTCPTCHSYDIQPLVRKSIHGSSIRFTPAHFQSNLIQCGSRSGKRQEAEKQSTQCSFCGGTAIHMGGPIYAAPIHDPIFVQQLLDRVRQTPVDNQLGTHQRLLGMLTVISEELHDVPLFYEFDQLMTVIKCSVPKLATFRSAILNAGFRCSGSHCNPKALKTDAPTSFLWDICRAWAKKSEVNVDKLKKYPIAQSILKDEQTSAVNFTSHKDAVPASKLANILRFQHNKGKNWGPKSKAKGNVISKKC